MNTSSRYNGYSLIDGAQKLNNRKMYNSIIL